MLFYRAALPLSCKTLNYAAGIIRRHHGLAVRERDRGALGERANAPLKTWKIFRKVRCCPWRAGQLAKAIHALPIHGV